MKIDHLLKTLRKQKKKNSSLQETISSFIKEFEMNIQFSINNNVYNSFQTILQLEDSNTGNQFKMIRHFYFYDEEMLQDGGDEDMIYMEGGNEDDEDEEGEEEFDDEEEEEDDDKKNSKKNKHVIEMKIDLRNSKRLEALSKTLSKRGSVEQTKKDKKMNSMIQKKLESLKNEKGREKEKDKKKKKNEKEDPLAFYLKNRYSNIQSLSKKKEFVDFNQDITFYYFIKEDQNELCEEYNFENHKLKSYQGDDLPDKTLDDYFLEHCEEVNTFDKIPIYLEKDYFDHEFSMFNLFKIDFQGEKKPLGDYLKGLWIANGNLSVFDSFLNYILNRILIMDKYIKMTENKEDDRWIEYMNLKMDKEMDLNKEIQFYSGKLDLQFGIENKIASIHEVGVFLKIIFTFILILDRSTPHKLEVESKEDEGDEDEDEEDDNFEDIEEEVENELRFNPILKTELGELEETIENVNQVIGSFFVHHSEHKDIKQILHEFNDDYNTILFGLRLKLFNEYMLEYLHKMYYNKTIKTSNFVSYHQEIMNDFKKILTPNVDDKDVDSIIVKWSDLADIQNMYKTIVGNIIQLS